MEMKKNKDKFKFKKANLSNILSFVLLLNLFFGLMIAMMFNSITQERRSMVVDYINKEAMTLQANLNGYSTNDKYCYMYENGVRVTSRSRIDYLKNKAIEDTEVNIKKKFSEPRYKSQMVLNNIDITISDGGSLKDVAKVKISVKYKALFRSPFNDEEGEENADSIGKMGVNILDTVSRTIENPVRLKNLK